MCAPCRETLATTPNVHEKPSSIDQSDDESGRRRGDGVATISRNASEDTLDEYITRRTTALECGTASSRESPSNNRARVRARLTRDQIVIN